MFEDNEQSTTNDVPVALHPEGVPPSPSVVIRSKGITALRGSGVQLTGPALQKCDEAFYALNQIVDLAGWKSSITTLIENYAAVSFEKIKQGDLFQPKVSAENLRGWIFERFRTASNRNNKRKSDPDSPQSAENAGHSIPSQSNLDADQERAFESALKKLAETGVEISETPEACPACLSNLSSFARVLPKIIEPVMTEIVLDAVSRDGRVAILFFELSQPSQLRWPQPTEFLLPVIERGVRDPHLSTDLRHRRP